jgi:hypothetical protein
MAMEVDLEAEIPNLRFIEQGHLPEDEFPLSARQRELRHLRDLELVRSHFQDVRDSTIVAVTTKGLNKEGGSNEGGLDGDDDDDDNGDDDDIHRLDDIEPPFKTPNGQAVRFWQVLIVFELVKLGDVGILCFVEKLVERCQELGWI